MGHILIDPQQVEQLASQIQTNVGARESDLSSLSRLADPSAFWQSTAAAAYTEKFEAWQNAEKNLIQALEGLGQVIRQIAQNFDLVNQQGYSALQ